MDIKIVCIYNKKKFFFICTKKKLLSIVDLFRI